MAYCVECKKRVKKGRFRCNKCADKFIMDPNTIYRSTARSVFKNGRNGSEGIQ